MVSAVAAETDGSDKLDCVQTLIERAIGLTSSKAIINIIFVHTGMPPDIQTQPLTCVNIRQFLLLITMLDTSKRRIALLLIFLLKTKKIKQKPNKTLLGQKQLVHIY